MRAWLAIVVLLLSCSVAGAEMYQWIAEDGSVTFKDTPPPASKKRGKVKVYHDGHFAAAPPQQEAPPSSRPPQKSPQAATAPEPARSRFSGTVEIFVTDWCGYCKQAEAYMRSNNIAYVAYNIEKDKAAHQRFQELGGRGVPLILIGQHRMAGFSAKTLEHYLATAR